MATATNNMAAILFPGLLLRLRTVGARVTLVKMIVLAMKMTSVTVYAQKIGLHLVSSIYVVSKVFKVSYALNTHHSM